jgi:hypothetical protein
MLPCKSLLEKGPIFPNEHSFSQLPNIIESGEQPTPRPSGAAVARVIPVRSIHKVIRSNRVLVISFAFEHLGIVLLPEPDHELERHRDCIAVTASDSRQAAFNDATKPCNVLYESWR